MVKMLAVRLNDQLVQRMKDRVAQVKKERTYSLGELVRVAVEKHLKEIKDDGRN